MTFKEFLHAYQTNALDRDAAWRAYDIPAAVKPGHIRSALKALKLAYAGELALPEFMARYGVPTREQAQAVLGAWWLWSVIDAGRAMRVPLRATRAATLPACL